MSTYAVLILLALSNNLKLQRPSGVRCSRASSGVRRVRSIGATDSARELRTCDAAYLLVYKIVRVRDAETEHFSAENQLKTLVPIQRDSEIEKWVLSETWKEVFPGTVVEDPSQCLKVEQDFPSVLPATTLVRRVIMLVLR